MPGAAVSLARGILFAATLQTLVAHAAHAQTNEAAMKVRFTLNGTVVTATLEDNATTRDFIAMLPLTVTLEDFAATEKIAYLPRKLSTQRAPSGIDPKAGDVTYYAPWGNLALFHKDFRHSPGLVKLGHIDQGIEALRITGSAAVTVEQAKD